MMGLEAAIISSVYIAEEVGGETARERGMGDGEVMLRAEII